jgi:predicted phage tail component-like protein
MARMIYYGGEALETVAPVKIVDIVDSGVQIVPKTRDRPIRPGTDFVRNHLSERTITVTFALLTQDMLARNAQIESLLKWAYSREPKRLELPTKSGRYLMAVCTQLPGPSARQWFESSLTLVFTCYDPFWYDVVEHHANCGDDPFYVNGSGEPVMRIEDTLDTAAQRVYSDGTDTMTFTLVPAGDLVIDLEQQTAKVDGVSCMDQFTFSSSFILPHTGQTTITGSGTVYWRERWL